MFSTLRREFRYISDLIHALRYVKDVDPESTNLLPDDLEKVVDRHSGNIAFLEDDKSWTYGQFDIFANRVAHWALSEGLVPGDTVAIFVRNRLEYVAMWYGLTKVGVLPALLNFQLTSKALSHCVKISDAKIIIVDHELEAAYKGAKRSLPKDVKSVSVFGAIKGMPLLDEALEQQPKTRPDRSHRDGIKAGVQLLKMFTSGTTGLPKAAKVTHVRGQNYMRGFAAMARTKSTDRMMMVLPLYHATGGLCGVGAALMEGGAVIVRPRFSASQFWDECVEYDATLFMYVGELCRFLLSSPPHPQERAHKLRFIIGNGLRPDVWPGFVKRFDIPNVIEFYGATEGNVSLVNIRGRQGAIGRIPGYMKSRFNARVIAYDVETGRNPRGVNGFCRETEPDEVGELVGRIDPEEARFRFDGYEDKTATKKKILENVFEKGDAYFRTGDLVKRDKEGYFYFIDRVGDTFRWKAENVATGEVAEVLTAFEGIIQANVYGVQVPGHDGRAGMAALVTAKKIDMKALAEHMCAGLPHYAVPVFLRLSSGADTTSTFKFKKTNLIKEGFNIEKLDEPVYVLLPKSDEYQILSPEVYKEIIDKDIRL